jgi:two-component system response regulator MprA
VHRGRERQTYERLSEFGFNIDTVTSGFAALQKVSHNPPDIVALNALLPDNDASELCRLLRASGWTRPIMVLNDHHLADDCIRALSAGADDYVSAPIVFDELVARLHALVRRHSHSHRALSKLHIADVVVDLGSRDVWRGDQLVSLTTKEFDLLVAFLKHPRQVLTRDQLLEQVWHLDSEVDTHVVEVYVGYLRKKLESRGEQRLIHTIRGVGYVLKEVPLS